VVRALRLLRSFRPETAGLSLGQLADAVGLSKSTAHRLLQALESEGLVDRSEDRSLFRLGPEMIALGSQALQASDLRQQVRPSLERLALETGESANLEVLLASEMLVLDAVRGRHLIAASLEIGTRWPVHATSTGRSIMASMGDAEREALITVLRESDLEPRLGDAEALRASLSEVGERGYSVAREELEPGFVAVGVAFRGPLGEIPGAISLGGPASRFTAARQEALGLRLRAEADSLSRTLQGGRGTA